MLTERGCCCSELVLVSDDALTVSVVASLSGVLWSFALPSHSLLAASQRIASVWSGYVDAYDSAAVRHQVLVVVTAGLDVVCFDSRTRLMLWSASLPADDESDADEDEDEQAEQDEQGDYEGGTRAEAAASGSQSLSVSVLVNPHPMRVNDSGVVIVGCSSAARPHFSFFAFAGRSGLLRWRHNARDAVESSGRAAAAGLDAAYSLLEQHSVHTGEVEWRNYRAAFLSSLPHSHQSPADARLSLAQLSPPQQRQGLPGTLQAERERGESSARASVRIASALPSSRLAVAASARLAHADDEHIALPNAVVAHTADGVELISLYTGRAIAHLPLPPLQLHADVNGDGVIDHVQVLDAAASASFLPSSSSSLLHSLSPASPRCVALVSSSVPPSTRLFNVSVCSSAFDRVLSSLHRVGAARASSPFSAQSMLGRRHLRMPRYGNGTAAAGAVERDAEATVAQRRELNADGGRDAGGGEEEAEWLTAPLALRRAPPSSSSLQLYFLSSSGLLTAVDGADGGRLYARRTGAAFTADGQRTTRRLLPFVLRSAAGSEAAADCLLLTGRRRLLLLDRRDGHELAAAELPDTAGSLSAAVTGDLNGDGYTDVALSAEDGLHVLLMQVHRGSQLYPRLLLALTAAVAAVVAARLAIAVRSQQQSAAA